MDKFEKRLGCLKIVNLPFSVKKLSNWSTSPKKPTDSMPQIAAIKWTGITPTGSSILSLSMSGTLRQVIRPPMAPITSPSHGRAKAQYAGIGR